MNTILTGIAAADGYGFGKAFKLVEPDLTFNSYTVSNSEKEVSRLHQALMLTECELKKIHHQVLHNQGNETAKIFNAHTLVLQDPELLKAFEGYIKEKQVNAEQALNVEINQFITKFEQMDNEYMRERAVDIKDVRRRVLAHLLNKPLPNVSLVKGPVIIIARDLVPSYMAQMNQTYIKGFVTDEGSKTSHAAIMARMLGIPAVMDSKRATTMINEDEEVIVDGTRGTVTVCPTDEVKTAYSEKQRHDEKQLQDWRMLKNQSTVTEDGHRVSVSANIGSVRHMDIIKRNGAEGIGLYRTEFLYMEQSYFPTESEQVEAYQHVLEAMEHKTVVIRTIDIGGDKELDYWKLSKDVNPVLGERGIRLALNNTDVFRTQLRALIRASHHGNLCIMFPMIATMEELRMAKALFLEEKEKLATEGIPISRDIPLGIIVETPATAILAAQFSKEVDFFSIGTNDLIQYTFAADRMNEAVSYLYQPYHPAILNIVGHVIKAAHREGKWVSMCGEMAGDSTAVPLLLGLGLDEFSVNPSAILRVRNQILHLKHKEMTQLAERACTLSTSEEVHKLVTKSHT